MARSKKVTAPAQDTNVNTPTAPAQDTNVNTPTAPATITLSNAHESAIMEASQKGKEATALKKKAALLLVASGWRGHMLTEDAIVDGLISQDTYNKFQRSIALGMCDTDQYALWLNGKQAAATNGLSKERNAITKDIGSYVASFRAMIETAWKTANPALATEEKKAAELKKEEADKKAEAEKKAAEQEAANKAMTLEVLHAVCLNLNLAVAVSQDAGIVRNREQLLKVINVLDSLTQALVV